MVALSHPPRPATIAGPCIAALRRLRAIRRPSCAVARVDHAQPPRLYDRISGRYDAMHRRWLRHAGGSAQTAFEAALASHLAPGVRMLDAGCGTGHMARRLLAGAGRGADITLLDSSAEMLARAADIPVRRVKGCLLDLPFAADRFDIVSAAWSIEATPEPARALHEMVRVLKPAGQLFLVFCAQSAAAGLPARLLCKTIKLRGTGTFLDAASIAALAESLTGQAVVHLPCEGPAVAMVIRKAAARSGLRAA